jgi:hypothetical protein
MVTVTAETEIEGTPEVGLQAEVEGWQYAQGTLVATEIEIDD